MRYSSESTAGARAPRWPSRTRRAARAAAPRGPGRAGGPAAPRGHRGAARRAGAGGARAAGVSGPAAARLRGAGGGGQPHRARDRGAHRWRAPGIAERVVVRSDGETALYGALEGGAGHPAHRRHGLGGLRPQRGRPDRAAAAAGGWWWATRAAATRSGARHCARALMQIDGRGARTRLLPVLLEVLGLSVARRHPALGGPRGEVGDRRARRTGTAPRGGRRHGGRRDRAGGGAAS